MLPSVMKLFALISPWIVKSSFTVSVESKVTASFTLSNPFTVVVSPALEIVTDPPPVAREVVPVESNVDTDVSPVTSSVDPIETVLFTVKSSDIVTSSGKPIVILISFTSFVTSVSISFTVPKNFSESVRRDTFSCSVSSATAKVEAIVAVDASVKRPWASTEKIGTSVEEP